VDVHRDVERPARSLREPHVVEVAVREHDGVDVIGGAADPPKRVLEGAP
jgi:hypothetical protein